MYSKIFTGNIGCALLLVLVLVINVLWTSQANAQIAGATLSGTVMDPSGAAVPNAEIVITDVNTNLTRTVNSSSAGFYSAPNLLPGVYTPVSWDGSVVWNKKLLDAGGGINPAKLPLDPARGCVPVYPHTILRVNTIFEIVHFAGMRTAWIDKHPSYEMVNGPSGVGVDDIFMPE